METCHKLLFLIFWWFVYMNEIQSRQAAPFRITEQFYIRNPANLTSISKLEDFFDVQSGIYIDNVYGAYQRFCYKLLGDLPRCQKYQGIKEIVDEMENFLVEEDSHRKCKQFDEFSKEFSATFDEIFEYDSEDFNLTLTEFNNIFVSNQVENMLNYIHLNQDREFVQTTGDGIRLFLILKRGSLDKQDLPIFQAAVNKFLESSTFIEKRRSLKLFINVCESFISG